MQGGANYLETSQNSTIVYENKKKGQGKKAPSLYAQHKKYDNDEPSPIKGD